MSFVNTSVNRPVTVWMFTLAVLLFGSVSLSRLAINLLPELSYPTLTIRTNYTGAAPGEIEQLISKPVEEAVGVVKGVRTVTSISKAGQSDVVLQFEWGTEMDMASLEVREKLDVLQLPLDIDKPLLLRFNPSLDPIIKFGFGLASSDNDTLSLVQLDTNGMKRLRTYAEEEIKRRLESVDGVASVQIGGGLENEIHVLVNQSRASQLNISVAEIVTRLQNENINASGGRIQDGSQEFLVRTLNQFASLQEIRDVFIATRNGRPIRLGDLATITDTHKEQTSVTRFDGQEGVEIAIYKEGDANTVQVAKNVNARIDQLVKDLPAQYHLQPVYDQSTFISNAIDQVKSAALFGGLLAMLILFLFLKNIWPTLIISISIPVSIIATFNLMYGSDISLNIMSLGGIALAIGLLVDNSIVVLENIDRHKRKNISPKEAATKGTKEVSMAIVASTLTTMAVFFPLVFVEGIAGQLFRDQALTVTFALAVSLVVALSLIPMLAAREFSKKSVSSQPDLSSVSTAPASGGRIATFFYTLAWPVRQCLKVIFYYLPVAVVSLCLLLFRGIKKLLGALFTPVLWLFERCYRAIDRAYQWSLTRALQAQAVVLILMLVISGASLMLLPRLGMNLIPAMSQGEFYAEISLPSGAQINATDSVLSELAQFTQSQNGVAHTYSLAGTGSLMNAAPSQGGDYWGRLNVVMKEHASATDEQQVIAKMRQYLQSQPGVTSKFGTPELFSFATPLEIHLVGYNLAQLRSVSEEVVKLLDQQPRFTDVKSSLQNGKPELKVDFDHTKLAQLGLNSADVSKLLASKIGGQIATQYNIDDRKVNVLVRAEEAQRDSVADVSNIIINPGMSPGIPLSAVATATMSIGPSEITRSGQQRVAVISSNLSYGDLGDAVADATALLENAKLPANIETRIAGQSEEMQNSFTSLKFALALAVFMVYLVMASQFESLFHPFLILCTVPMACAGSIYGLFLTGTSLSVVVFIGLIMLAGIVVNNGIVLIDRINQLRRDGMHKTEAVKQAAFTRLRPIMMTTLTTTLGLLPMAVGFGDGAEIRTPMAITVIFGLLFASALTLFVIPLLYNLLDRKRYVEHDNAQAQSEEPVYG